MALQLKIVSIERVIFSGQVKEITLPGEMSRFTILPKHAPIISSLSEGYITFAPLENLKREEMIDGLEQLEGETQILGLKIKEGFVEMSEDYITVCVTEDKD